MWPQLEVLLADYQDVALRLAMTSLIRSGSSATMLAVRRISRPDHNPHRFLHLEKGDQFDAAYWAINPQMVVPTLVDGDVKLFQSLAILEYLDEAYPEPPLLPADPLARAWVRGLAFINVADAHPLIVPRVRHYLTDVLKVTDDQRLA
jgi:Glutathione S-transferase, N-terminal domain